MGNLGSVLKALKRLKISASITSDEATILKAEKIILPGVGHFGSAMKQLKQSGLKDILNENVIDKKKPILGICLGMQLMADYSEEGDTQGFGWINSNVVAFKMKNKLKYKVPHIGWNSLEKQKESPLFKDINLNSLFYFDHSYYMSCNDKADILCSTTYSHEFTSAVCKENIFGAQFHPEKSHDWGLQILNNFNGIN